ncbi:hypothetical protein [Aliarcobacter cryaerophilus]|jgi:hypothetical protein|nr:hypothetical protein [Aliarcobacter cryaerophilus]MCT7471983.1 hypothetical protein [Aliarcobacter cryaerophilus]
MRKIMRNELTKSIKYLEQDIAKDKLKVKKTRNSWLQVLRKIILYV